MVGLYDRQGFLRFAGGSVDARAPGDGKFKVIEDAPGSYAKVRI